MSERNNLRYLRMLEMARKMDALSPRPVGIGTLKLFLEEMCEVGVRDFRQINRAQYRFRKMRRTGKEGVPKGSENVILKSRGEGVDR